MSDHVSSHEQASYRSCPTCRAIYRTDFDRCPSDGGALEITDHDPLIGCVLADRYVIESLIGEGGIARVYRASHKRLAHQVVAIKVMFGDFASTLQMRMRFTREAETASRLAHPNVVSAFDLGRTPEGLMYLAMELVEGRTLGDLIDGDGPLGVPRTIALARQLCEGLAYAHDQGLVHRDFKPDNVLVVAGQVGEIVRITDFGLAITVDLDLDRDVRFTAAGFAVGTPIYAAPEQAYDEASIDHRADIFSLGVTLYEMLAGRPPYDGHMLELLRQNAHGSPPSIKERSGVDVPEALEALVRRMLAPSPAARPSSVREVLAELEQIALGPAAIVSLASAEAAPVETSRPTQRGRWTMIGVSLPALVIAAFVWSSRGKDAPAPTPSAAVQPPAAAPQTTPRADLPAPTPSADSQRPVPPRVAEGAVATPPTVARATPSPARDRSAPTPGRTSSSARPLASSRAGQQDEEEPAPRVESTPARTEPTPPRAEPTPPRAEPAPPRAEPAPPRAEPTPPRAEPTPPRAEPTPPAPIPSAVTVVPAPPPRVPRPPVPPPSVTIDNLRVRGSLATSVVRRALERVQPSFAKCYARLGARLPSDNVAITFRIDEHGRIVEVAAKGLAATVSDCLRSAFARGRTSSPPDVGTVRVSLTLAMTRGVP